MPIARTEFGSGLRVVTERMPSVRSVSLGFWVLAGSRDEAPRISGSSHFLEHLLFKGTSSRTALQIAENFDAVGGDVNAFTAKEYTCYYARVRDRDLEMAVDHFADMLQDSLIRKADLDAERQVILEEIHMHEDSPEDVVHDLFTETLWPEHPLGRPILGTVETVEAATPTAGEAVLPQALCPRDTWSWPPPATCSTTTLLAMLRARMDTGRVIRTGQPSEWRVRSGGRAPVASGVTWCAAARPSRPTSAWAPTGWTGPTPIGSRSWWPTPRWVAACRPGCSRRSARSAASPIPSTATTPSTPRPGCSPATRAPRPAERRRWSGCCAASWPMSATAVSPPRSSSARRAT